MVVFFFFFFFTLSDKLWAGKSEPKKGNNQPGKPKRRQNQQ